MPRGRSDSALLSARIDVILLPLSRIRCFTDICVTRGTGGSGNRALSGARVDKHLFCDNFKKAKKGETVKTRECFLLKINRRYKICKIP